jgi:hypothetical protein
MIGKRELQRVGARNTCARVVRFDVDFIRVSNACMIIKCPLYGTGKSAIGTPPMLDGFAYGQSYEIVRRVSVATLSSI